MTKITGLVLSGGGARGAYQVGALRALAEILPPRDRFPFPVLAGASAGSITSAFLAAHATEFSGATERLVDFWSRLRPHDVFRTDSATLLRVAAGWASDLSLGGAVGGGRGRSLLLTDPLRALLTERLDMDAVRKNVELGILRGVAITATNYRTNLAVTFFDGAREIAPWGRSTRIGMRDRLTVDHVMASSAIPMFFPPVRIGDKYYADGCVRLTTPLSPAVHLGAERILAIGVRVTEPPPRQDAAPSGDPEPYPTVAETAGLLLNALFLEALESDVERFARINHTMSLVPPEVAEHEPAPLRAMPLLVLRPSRDLGALAVGVLGRLPRFVQHLFRGLGATEAIGADLLSYLAFDAEYASALLALGHADVLSRRDEILAFME